MLSSMYSATHTDKPPYLLTYLANLYPAESHKIHRLMAANISTEVTISKY